MYRIYIYIETHRNIEIYRDTYFYAFLCINLWDIVWGTAWLGWLISPHGGWVPAARVPPVAAIDIFLYIPMCFANFSIFLHNSMYFYNIFLYICISSEIFVYVSAYLYIFMYNSVYPTHIYVYAHICINAYIYIYIHKYIYIYIYMYDGFSLVAGEIF